MEKKANFTNSSFAVQFSKACYAYLFIRETFPGVSWRFDVTNTLGAKIEGYFDETPEGVELCHTCAQQLTSLFPDIEVKTTIYDNLEGVDPFRVVQGTLQVVIE